MGEYYNHKIALTRILLQIGVSYHPLYCVYCIIVYCGENLCCTFFFIIFDSSLLTFFAFFFYL